MAQMSRSAARAKRRRRILRNRILFVLAILAILAGVVFGISRLTAMYRKAHLPKQSLQAVQAAGLESDETNEGAQGLAGAQVSSLQSDWRMVLVNPNVKLPDDYTVETETADAATGKELQTEAAEAYRQMAKAAEADGVSLMLCSGYRSVEYQQGLFDKKVEQCLSEGLSQEDAEIKAATIVAAPGHSEHNTGLAADIVAPDHQMLDTAFEQTPAFAWLSQHAAEYGFILRYPRDKTAITGIIYEPWHYRYVGVDNAAAILQSGGCLEEYLARLTISDFNSEQSAQ